ncbi:aldo/keto reductase [Alicyclobacillus suci]|uniref:aldo/keto reductase n=1 Tax=Alicyclobacillus suci TaxID=2816080 RepID=UPI002E2CDF51|nr:aldo/keto reductase [Alicyclobacillus suci]
MSNWAAWQIAKALGISPQEQLARFERIQPMYNLVKRPAQGRLVDEARYIARYRDEMNFVVADRFVAYAEKHGINPATLAVAWVMSHPAVTAPIIGARTVAQLEDSLAAVDVGMTPAWRDEISALSVEPAPATDRGETLLPNWN